MPNNRCPKGTRKNKNGDCVEKKHSLPSTEIMTSSNSKGEKKTYKQFGKNKCVRSRKTNRCKKSFKSNKSSVTCKLFQKTQRCRGIKEEKFIMYKNYKVKKDVQSFLEKNVIHVPLKTLIASAEKDPDYEYTLQFMFEDESKTETEIKKEFEEEILDLSHHHARDNGFDVITMKSVKHVLAENGGFKFLLK